MAYRRDRALLNDRAQKKKDHQPRCRLHHTPRCDQPQCVRAALQPKKIYHKGDTRPGERHGRRNGDLRGFRAENRLEELFRSLRIPRVEIEPYEAKENVGGAAKAVEIQTAATDVPTEEEEAEPPKEGDVYKAFEKKLSLRELIQRKATA